MTPAIWHPCKNSLNPNEIGVGQGVQKQTSLTPSHHKFDQKPDNFVKPSRDWVLLKSTQNWFHGQIRPFFTLQTLSTKTSPARLNTSTLVLRLARIEAQLVLEQGVARHKEIVSGRQAAQIMRAPLNIGFDLRGHALLLTLFSTWAPNWLWWLHTWPYWQYWALIWSCYDQNGSFDHLLFCREGSDHQNGWIFRFKYDQQWREEGWRRMKKGRRGWTNVSQRGVDHALSHCFVTPTIVYVATQAIAGWIHLHFWSGFFGFVHL